MSQGMTLSHGDTDQVKISQNHCAGRHNLDGKRRAQLRNVTH